MLVLRRSGLKAWRLRAGQTFTHARGPEQLDGAYGAVTAETDEARGHGFWLARMLGLEPFTLANDARPLYHAGAAIASNCLGETTDPHAG